MYGIAQSCEFRHYLSERALSSRPLRMPDRRLDDRIRHLSTQLAGASNIDVEPMLQELLAAIHEKLERLRTRAAERFLHGKRLIERRAMPSEVGISRRP